MSSVGKHTQPVSGFSPLNFGGCSLWLDATATSNFALTGSNVTAWYDKSPLSNHATSVSGGSPVLSNTAINGRPGVYFSNAPSIGGPLTLSNTGVAGFILARPLQSGVGRNSDQRIFSAADTGQGDYNSTLRFLIGVQQQQDEIRMYRGGGIIPAGRMNASNTYIISWNYDGTTHSFFLNGVPGEITPTVVNGGLPFSSSRYQLGNQVILTPEVYNGMIGEVIIYNDALLPAQRQAVEGYLAWKWGIAPALGTTFSPLTSLPSCAVWFDGADPSAFTLSGSNITQWRDKAGSNVTSNIGTPVYVSNAVNGVPGVQLDVNSGFQISPMSNAANTTTLSIYGLVTTGSGAQPSARLFTVGRVSDGVANNDYSSSSLWTLYRPSTEALELQHTGNIVSSGSALTVGKPCLVSVVFSGTTATLWANGYRAGSINTTNTLIFDRIGIGKNINNNAGSSSDSFAGTIGEFLIFYAAHTDAQRLQVESYLASKWNVPMRAPPHLIPTHPYTKTRPFLRDFFPTDAPGCALWLDAGDRSTLTLSSSNTVTGWADKSGNRRPLTVNSAGTYSATGFNGRPTIQFTNGQYMTTSTAAVLTNSFTVFLVHQITGTGQGNCVFATGSADSNIASFFRTDFNTYQIGQGNGNGGSTGNWYYTVQTNPLVESFTVRPVAPYWNQYLNGVRSVNPNIGGQNTGPYPNVGNSNVFIPGAVASGNYIGNISEVLIFSNALSSPQRQLVENYLATKWGHRGYMQGPLAHPFRYGPPTGITLDSAPAGVAFWLDAADASTLTLSGSNVTQWRDKAMGYVGSAVSNPVYATVDGVPAVTFNGSTQYVNFGDVADLGTAPLNIFVVSKFNSTASGAIFAKSAFGTAGRYSLLRENGNLGLLIEGSAAISYPTTADTNTSRRILAWTWDRTTNSLFQNGAPTPLVSAGFSDTTRLNTSFVFLVGAYNDGGTGGVPPTSGLYFNGSVNEILAIFGTLTTTQRQQIEGYLAAKWGLSSTFPVGHPYLSGPQTSITPAVVPRCRLWLDAADSSTLTLSGSNVTAWRDKIGQTTLTLTGTPPTYVSNQVRFNSSGRFQGAYTMTTQTTMFLVYSTSNTTTNSRLVTGDGSNGYGNVHAPVGTDNDLFVYTGGGPGYYTTLTPQTGRRMYTIAFNGPTTAVWRNGSAATMAGTAANATATGSNIAIGASLLGENPWSGDLAELIFFDTLLTTSQRQSVEGYLSWKWGLPTQLPGGAGNTAALYKSLTVDFDPRSVGACGAWFDAADLTTVQFASGSNIARWLDKSGFQNHLATNSSNQGFWPTYTSNTLNGKPVVTFSNAGMLGGYGPPTSTTPHTIFVVARPAALPAGQQVLFQISMYPNGITSGFGFVLADYASYKWYVGALYGGNEGNYSNNTVASISRTDVVAGTWYGGSNVNTTTNGVTGSDSTQTPGSITTRAAGGRMTVGGHWYVYENYYRNFYNGYMAEILVFSNALGVADRQRIEGYLAWKWGLQSQLPALHPYSNASY